MQVKIDRLFWREVRQLLLITLVRDHLSRMRVRGTFAAPEAVLESGDGLDPDSDRTVLDRKRLDVRLAGIGQRGSMNDNHNAGTPSLSRVFIAADVHRLAVYARIAREVERDGRLHRGARVDD